MPRILLALGALALLTTVAALCTQIALSLHIHQSSHGRTASIASAVLESAVLVLLVWLCATTVLPVIREQSKRWLGIAFGLTILACTFATVASIVALVYLSKATDRSDVNILIGSSIALGFSLPSQFSFLAFHFASAQMTMGTAWSFHKDEEAGRSRKINLKAIRYSQTLPAMSQSQDNTDFEPQSLSSSSGGKSAVETIRSSVNSMSHVIRPISSKTKLLLSKEKHRSASLDSNANRNSGDHSFDSWDTSAVDLHNRLVVLEVSSPIQPKTFSLETIPASPIVSRSPTPDSLVELEPPHVRRRSQSRSYSPVSLRRELQDLPPPGTPGSNYESHIHPLFRSDSPDPPPLATPGTSVVAAPDAARVILHRPSNRSLNRMRSDSLPVTPSPLSKHGSFDNIGLLEMQSSELVSLNRNTLMRAERKMTPPVPEWLLSGNAGSRLS